MPNTHTARLTTHDSTRIDDTRISAVRPLITPALLEEKPPSPTYCTARTTASSWWWGRAPSTTMTRPWNTRASFSARPMH